MSKISILLCLVAATFAQNVEDPLVEFVKGNAQFSADVLKEVYTDPHNKGIISPLSVQLVLALTAEGAKGKTYDQLKKALSLPDKERTTQAVRALVPLLNKSSKNFNISLADKLYVSGKFKVKKDFEKVAVEDYKSEVQNVNFGECQKTTNLINKWVEGKTNNKIHNLIRPNQLDVNTSLVLVNALYLNGKWKISFPVPRTRKDRFYYLDNTQGEVEMMHSIAPYLYRYCGYLQAKFLEIPFKDSNVTFTAILPDKRNGIVDLHKHVELFLEPHNLTERFVNVSFPKFSASTYHDFKELVSKLGATDVFGKDADLSDISDDGLFVNFAQQKAFINITETGTEPDTASTAGVQPLDRVLPPIIKPDETFNADHPFFYYIRESTTNTLLFVGRFQ